MEDVVNWILGGGSLMISIGGALCSCLLPLAILTGLGFYIANRSKRSKQAREAAASWLTTSGMVVTSTVQIRRSGRSRSEIPVVVYVYQVNGQNYQGSLIRAGDQFGTIRVWGDSQKIIARYPVGSSVTVYYNPANPAEAALER